MDKVIEKIVRYSRGWLSYFSKCETSSVLKSLSSWLRRRIRSAYWRQWKTGRNRFKQLIKLGIRKDLSARTAGSGKGPWRISCSPALNIGMPNSYFEKLGIPKFSCRTW